METQTQWEYKRVQIDLKLNADALLTELGLEEWELVSVDNGQAYLKRTLPPPKQMSGIKVTGRMG